MTFRVRLGETPMSAIASAARVNAEILGWSIYREDLARR
jgi:hypothetical protein